MDFSGAIEKFERLEQEQEHVIFLKLELFKIDYSTKDLSSSIYPLAIVVWKNGNHLIEFYLEQNVALKRNILM